MVRIIATLALIVVCVGAARAELQGSARSLEAGGHDAMRLAQAGPPRDALIEAQQLLARLGYQPGPADGHWGTTSQRAYANFLRDRGLPPEPEMRSPEDLRRLRAAAEAIGSSPARPQAQAPPKAPVSLHRLHQVTIAGDIVGLQAVLEAGVDVNRRDGKGLTALMHAAAKGYVLLVEHLLAAKADPDLRAPTGATALYLAAQRDHAEIAALLIKAGADPSIRGPKGRTPAEIAWARENGPVIEALGPAGAPSPARVRDAHKLLHELHYVTGRAVWNEVGPGYVEWLIDHDRPKLLPLTRERLDELRADLEELKATQSAQGCARLCSARFARTASAAEAIAELRDGASINARNGAGETALHLAVHHGNLALTRLLLARGGDVNANDSRRETALHRAVLASGGGAVAALLLDHGADPNARDVRGETPLHAAVRGDAGPAVAVRLLEHGARIDSRAEDGRTPLHIAVARDADLKIIRLLLDRGADINAADGLRVIRQGKRTRNAGKDTVLHLAARGDINPESLLLLLERGASLEIENAAERRPRAIATDVNRAVIDDWLRRNRKSRPRPTFQQDHSTTDR